MSSSILFPTNQYTSYSKSSQQIQKLIIPQDIPENQVIMYLLNKNHPLQMPYVYKNFYKHYHHQNNIIQIITQKATHQRPQNQILICQSLKSILIQQSHQKLLSTQHLDNIFSMCLQCINNLNSPANEPLAQILQLLIKTHPTHHILLSKLQTQILSLGKPTQPTISKVTSGRLIAIVSKHIGKMIKGQMIDILKKILCDNQIEARKVWVGEIFPKLLEGLELDFVQLHLQEKIYQCVYDENQEICLMALKVILKNVTRFSVEEQASRIVKLFIDSLTSKNQKIAIMVTQIMGQIYQKLINIIMKSQPNCTRFWRSLVQIAQSKNQKLLNNLIFNLPGILLLSSTFHKTDPFVDIYCQLFYQPLANKTTLISYFHQIADLYPQKKQQLKQVVYWIFGELFDDDENQHDIEALKIFNYFIKNLSKCKQVFFIQNNKQLKQKNISLTNFDDVPSLPPQRSLNNHSTVSQNNLSNNTNNSKMSFIPVSDIIFTKPTPPSTNLTPQIFQTQFCQYLFKYLQLLQYHKNCQWLNLFYNTLKQISQYLPIQFIQKSLLPKLFMFIKSKSGSLQLLIQVFIILLKRDPLTSTSTLINYYISKLHVQFSKSSKSHQRQAVIQFLYFCSFYFSFQTYQEYKLGEKFLGFSNDKNFQNRFLFIKYYQRIQYFFSREEKIQAAIVISRLMKDSDPEIVQMMSQFDYTEKEEIKQMLIQESKLLKQKEKEKEKYYNNLGSLSMVNKSLKPLLNNRRQSKQLKKQQVLKKRIQTTKSKTKMLIKQVPNNNKKKMPNFNSTVTSKLNQQIKRNS